MQHGFNSGHDVVLEKNFNIHEVIIQTLFPITEKKTSCSQGKMSSQEHCLKLKRWQGPPDINKAEQKAVWNCVFVCLFNVFSQSLFIWFV